MDSVSPELVIVGRVRKAHGIRGDLVVESISDEPDAIFASGRRVFAGNTAGDPAKDGKTLTIATASPFKGGYIVHFNEIDDRSVAETWRDRYPCCRRTSSTRSARMRSTSTNCSAWTSFSPTATRLVSWTPPTSFRRASRST
jgi:ribosomal 30S subunit maturation factor RimM